MAKKTGGEHAPREKPRKRPGIHKKSKNKSEKLQQKKKKNIDINHLISYFYK
jgi:hypothetical protein